MFKSDYYSKFNNYRPISVLPAFSKLLERMYDRLLKFIEKYNILVNNNMVLEKIAAPL